MCRLNEAIDQALAESTARYAQEVERSKDLFLGVLGHDLRDPLEAILSTTAAVLDATPSGATKEAAARLLTSAKRMEGTIDQLLGFTESRFGAGIAVTLASMDMEIACREVLAEVAATHPTCTVCFEASGALKGEWDRARIGQALTNLILSAHQQRQGNAPVELVARGEPVGVVLTVHYKGPVIPRSKMHAVFDPFRQSSTPPAPTQRYAPSLGLSIAQAIVTAHHGTTQVVSTDAGTTFTVRLPRGRAAAAH